MTSRDFCYWLQGYFELREASPNTHQCVTFEQDEMIRRHLALVFAHEIDPQAGGPEEQAKLNVIHKPDPMGVSVRC